MQFLRECQVIIGNSQQALSFKDLKISFEIHKTNMSYPSKARVLIYNLSKQTRALIQNEFTNILINAGYQGNVQLIFSGNIVNIYHHIDDVDTITEIFAGDGDTDWQTGVVNTTFESSVPLQDMVTKIGNTFPTIKVGTLNGLDQPKIIGSSDTFSCSTRDALTELGLTYQFNWCIENGYLETWPVTGALSEQITATLISAATGMVGSPTVTEIGANVTTLLNPALQPNRWINIQAAGSDVNLGDPYFRVANKPTVAHGFYIINTVTHIFDNRGDDALTTVEARNPLQAVI